MIRAHFFIAASLLTSQVAVATPASSEMHDQLVLDATVVPAGMAAIFVPSLTRPDLEPVVSIFVGERRVATGPTGRRIIVAPGPYAVVLTSSDEALAQRYKVVAVPDRTTVVATTHASLQIDAVDGQGRLSNETVRITGADGQVKQEVHTQNKTAMDAKAMLLGEGRYLASLGDPADAEVSSVIIPLHAGERARYRLVVVDGFIRRMELGDDAPVERMSPWKLRWRLGGDISFQSARRQLMFSGDALQVGVSTELSTTYDRGGHLFEFDLDAAQSWLGVSNRIGRGLPLAKMDDGARASISYYYRLGRIFGPYARASARTMFFDTSFVANQDQTIVAPDGTERTIGPGQEVSLLKSMNPIVLQQGAGFGLTALDFEFVSLILRGGPALRQSRYSSGKYVEQGNQDRVVLSELVDDRSWGLEAEARLSFRFGDALWADSILDSYVPKGQILSDDALQPVFRWSNRIAWSFNSSTSLTYDFVLHRDEFGIDALQHRHLVSLRAHVSLL